MTTTEFMRAFQTKVKYNCPRHKTGLEIVTIPKTPQLNTIQ